MTLGTQTVRKFIREALLTATPMTLDEDGIAELKKRLTAWLGQADGLDLHWTIARQNRDGSIRSICSISLPHPRYRGASYGSFSLCLNAQGELFLAAGYREPHQPIGSIDELCTFLRFCRERAARMKGQLAKRTKVRKLRGAAINARVQQLARTFQFDYATSENALNLNLMLRFDDLHIVEVTIPFARFDQMLPQLESALPQLCELVRVGITASLRPRYAKKARREKWVLYSTLAGNDAVDSDLEE